MRVGIAGLGAMGSAIANRLAASEHQLTVWNRSPAACEEFAARGAEVADSPRSLIDMVDVCITMLSDGAAVEQVAKELCAGAGASVKRRLWVEMSTIDLAASSRVAERAASAGLGYLRAPVSGNPTVVAAGNLTIIASGPAEALEQARPLLEAIGPGLFHVGDADQARVMKLAVNLMIAQTTQMLAEALVIGEANQLDRAVMLEVMSASAVGSPFVKYKSQSLVEDDYAPTFSLALLAEDLDLILDAADAAGVPVPATAATRHFVHSAIVAGLGPLDMSALVPLLRRDAGLTDQLPSALA